MSRHKLDSLRMNCFVFRKLPTRDWLNTFLWWERFPSQLRYNMKEFQLVHYSDQSLPSNLVCCIHSDQVNYQLLQSIPGPCQKCRLTLTSPHLCYHVSALGSDLPSNVFPTCFVLFCLFHVHVFNGLRVQLMHWF